MAAVKRVAVVTGASRGLGAVVAQVLARRGYDLVIGARDEQALHEAAKSLQRFGGEVVTVHGDVADPWMRSWLIYEARQLGGLDVLVNNASELGGIRPVADVDLPGLERLLAVNVIAPVALVQLGLSLLQQRRGLVVNVSSDAARGGYSGWGGYGASKAALDLLTRTLHGELQDHGVAAVSVDPGDMRTRMHQEAFSGEDISDRPLPDVTIPFWEWLFDQDGPAVSGERFAAQEEDARWLQRV
ncbi:MAG: SDR family NAD(P)-dependent oxidoreductase [Vicinamibacterales bacterium]